MSPFMFKLIFLVSIELKHNTKLVQIVFLFFFYWPEFWKKQLGPETDEMCQFRGPETDPYCQFLGPEIMLTHFHDFWAQKLTKCVGFSTTKLENNKVRHKNCSSRPEHSKEPLQSDTKNGYR